MTPRHHEDTTVVITRKWRFLHPDEMVQFPDGYLVPWEDGFVVQLVTPRARTVFEKLTGERTCAPWFIAAETVDDFFLSCDEMSLWISPL